MGVELQKRNNTLIATLHLSIESSRWLSICIISFSRYWHIFKYCFCLHFDIMHPTIIYSSYWRLNLWLHMRNHQLLWQRKILSCFLQYKIRYYLILLPNYQCHDIFGYCVEKCISWNVLIGRWNSSKLYWIIGFFDRHMHETSGWGLCYTKYSSGNSFLLW